MVDRSSSRRAKLVQSVTPFEVEATALPSQFVHVVGDERIVGGPPQPVPAVKKLAGDGVTIRIAADVTR